MGQYTHTPVTQFFDDVYIPYRLRSCSPLTPGIYRTCIQHINMYWRTREKARWEHQLTIGNFTEPLIAQYLASRHDLSPASQNKHLRHLKAIWSLAVELDEDLGKMRLKPVREFLRVPECWSQEEFASLLEAAAKTFGRVGDVPARYWWPALIILVYATGVRIDAVMRIRTADLDLDRGEVLVRCETQKQKADQRFTLIPEAVQLVSAIRPLRNVQVFEDWPYDRNKRKKDPNARRNYRTLGDHYSVILERAGLSNGRHDKWHKLRRMFGTEIARSAGKAAAQQLLGHSTMRVTDRYIDPRFVESPDAASLLRRPSLPIQMRLFNPQDPGPDAGEARTG